ncbi:MAG: MBL fold metallo-hydrolase [Oscillospiraceae bacterium]|nr:MBL fold metallo-hydrolase [Oscillospiraceae bacterium]
MARFCPMFSSSRGNCTYIGSARGGILIDIGVSAKRTCCALYDLGIDADSIGAIFITHEHSDHISGLRVFAQKHGIRVYASAGTLSALDAMGVLNGSFSAEAVDENGVEVDEMFIRPFRTSHDARESVGYTVTTADNRRVSVATDTGVITDGMLAAINGSDLVMIESNHDIGMLQNGSYPYILKRRILSDRGHLSNDCCADTAAKLLNGGTARFVLAHLSQENNMPVLAYQATAASLGGIGAQAGEDYLLDVVAQGDAPKMITF